MALQLGKRERDALREAGYTVIPDAVDAAWRRRLMDRAAVLVEAFDADAHRGVFSTRDQSRTMDEYFVASANGIGCFFEEGAFDPDGILRQPKARSINKIGHALHRLDPAFRAFSETLDLAGAAAALGIGTPQELQSMFICKQPRIGGEVGLHQDATFLYTDPITVVGFWFALEDATVANGCLYAIPGGHERGLEKRFRREDEGFGFEPLTDIEWPLEAAVPLEVEAGSLVLLHGLLPHRSGPNTSDRSRQAYAVHFVDAAAHYPADNWLQPA